MIKILDGVPKTAGLRVRRDGEAWHVSMLVFTCSGYGRLSVLEQTYTIPTGGKVTLASKAWIYGPPQSWQTSGDYDENAQRALHDEVQRFRAAMYEPLVRRRTIEPFEKLCAQDPTFAEVRARLGEPDRDIGSGIHIYFYRLGDGTAVLIGAARDDDKLTYVRHVEVVEAGVGRPKIGRVLRSLKK